MSDMIASAQPDDTTHALTPERLGEAKALLRYETSIVAEVERLRAEAAKVRASGIREAAAFVDNDDICGCGGCDTCQPRKMAADLRRMAEEIAPSRIPLVVSRFDVAMEPAPEEPPVLTIGAVAEDGTPVALLLDLETRAKVGGWLAPAAVEYGIAVTDAESSAAVVTNTTSVRAEAVRSLAHVRTGYPTARLVYRTVGAWTETTS
ncbi:hypothetical protein [Streptomyces sp. NPDC088258]|uniref:hypothetical protein n=1 Tax=Streptomyces sp. NPDC088258 TaxID=3365849 RepID=UPI003828B0AE